MTLSVADRIFETSTTQGTGTLNLAGAVAGYRTFIAAVGTGKLVEYIIDDGTNWEVGIGTVTSGSPNTLARTTVIASSNANAAVNWGPGTRNVRCGGTAQTLLHTDEKLNFVRSLATGGGTANAQTATLPYTPLALTDGMEVWMYATVANTTAAWTLNVNSLGAKSVKINGVDGPVGASDIGRLMGFRYKLSDTTWQIINPVGELGAQSRNLSIGLNDTITTVASAATPDIWTNTGGVINYTGTTTSTNFAAAPQAGAKRILICAGISTFTNNANLIIDGGANFISAAGDRVRVIALTTTTFRLEPVKSNGQAVVSPTTLNSYVSAETAIANNGNATIAHSLGIVPKMATLFLRCKTAELGYAVDDEVAFGNSGYNSSANTNLTMNSTNFIITAMATRQLVNRSTFANAGITDANWKYVVRAIY